MRKAGNEATPGWSPDAAKLGSSESLWYLRTKPSMKPCRSPVTINEPSGATSPHCRNSPGTRGDQAGRPRAAIRGELEDVNLRARDVRRARRLHGDERGVPTVEPMK